MRPSTLFLVMTAAGAGLLLLLGLHTRGTAADAAARWGLERTLVRELSLTDLCLFTEARYTRHPTQADRHAAFQDHPLSLEHFPSGSVVRPPRHLWETPHGAGP